MKVHVYKLECLTNLHVGSGEINYGVIDKCVELDPVFGTPSIYSTGLKGALRAFAEENNVGEDKIKRIFGGENTDISKGEYKFMSASLLSRPMRVSNGSVSYVNATTSEIINNFIDLLDKLGANPFGVERLKQADEIVLSLDGVSAVEGITAVKNTDNNTILNNLIGINWALVPEKIFNSIDLPVVARNILDNGKSKNLWYEEFVSHKSVFGFAIITPNDENLLDELFKTSFVQIGANATVGYGFVKISPLKAQANAENDKRNGG